MESLIPCTTIFSSEEHGAGAERLDEPDPLPFTGLLVCAGCLALPLANVLSLEPLNDLMR